MQDNEIKSHLEWLKTVVDRVDSITNGKDFISAVLTYINRLESVNEALDTCKGNLISDKYELVQRIKERDAEIERLSALVKIQKSEDVWKSEYVCETVTSYGIVLTKTEKDYEDFIADISAEAYKEFAERLKEKKFELDDQNEDIFYAVEVADIDNLYKELVGEDNG